jgi:hypothetical protein
VTNQLFAALDWLPTLVDVGGGATGDALKNQIEAGQYPGIVKTTLDGFDQHEYLEGTSEKSARDYFFYFSGALLPRAPPWTKPIWGIRRGRKPEMSEALAMLPRPQGLPRANLACSGRRLAFNRNRRYRMLRHPSP